MSYNKTITYHDYDIDFEYEYDSENQCLILTHWQAYVANDPFDIPCRIESEFIQKELNKWLDYEWAQNGTNYIEEYEIYLQTRYM